MDKTPTWIPITTLVFLLLIISSASATTDASDVSALQDLYRTLSFPPQLTGWKTKGGDPCGELWKGVSCDGSSILYIKLNGLDLGGYLGEQLNLMNLKQLDLSSNHIQGAIPSLLPPNATNIDLSCNDFNMSIPYTLTSMKHMRHLNFSHNALSGPIGNVFTGLHNLKQMDLSFNNFTGDLPSSFGTLTNLTGLYLQNNKFTGSVIFLANLPLTELNIQNNHFSGVVPKQFQYVPNLWIGGNAFQIGGDYPSWNFPEDTTPSDQNINSPPNTESNAIENYPSLGAGEHQQKRFSPAIIACAVGGVALVATCAAFIIAILIKRTRGNSLQDLEDDGNSLPVSTHIDYAFDTPDEFPQSLASRSSPVLPGGQVLSLECAQNTISFTSRFRGAPSRAFLKAHYDRAEIFSSRCLFSKPMQGSNARVFCLDRNTTSNISNAIWDNCHLMASNGSGWVFMVGSDMRGAFFFNLRNDTLVRLPNLPLQQGFEVVGQWRACFCRNPTENACTVLLIGHVRYLGAEGILELVVCFKRMADDHWIMKRREAGIFAVISSPVILRDYVLWISDGDSLHSFSLLEEGEQIHGQVRLIPELIHGMYTVSLIIFGYDLYIYQEHGERAEVPTIIHFTNVGAVDLHEGLNGIGFEIAHSPHPLDFYCIAGGQGVAVGPYVRTPADTSEINFANNPIHLLKVKVHGGFAEYVEQVICSNDICLDYFAFVLEDVD